jgi:hypothetical protein
MLPSFFKLTRNRSRMFQSIEISVSHGNLFVMLTCEHTNCASSSTYLQSID